MKNQLLLAGLLTVLCTTLTPATYAQDATPAATTAPTAAPAPVSDELQALVGKIQAKLQEGKTTEADFAAELKGFDDLLAKHSAEKTDAVARILYMKAMLYLQVFENADQAETLVKQLQASFPDTKFGKQADKILASIAQKKASLAVQSELSAGATFPDFSEKDLQGNPLSVANYKGKVVLVDFWATWCGPCRGELPNVINLYKKFHGQGFEVIGVSLDSDRDTLNSFIKQQDGMTWSQYFDGQGWQNKLAAKYGVEAIPFTLLIGPDGKIIGKELRGEELAAAVEKALKK